MIVPSICLVIFSSVGSVPVCYCLAMYPMRSLPVLLEVLRDVARAAVIKIVRLLISSTRMAMDDSMLRNALQPSNSSKPIHKVAVEVVPVFAGGVEVVVLVAAPADLEVEEDVADRVVPVVEEETDHLPPKGLR